MLASKYFVDSGFKNIEREIFPPSYHLEIRKSKFTSQTRLLMREMKDENKEQKE